MKHKAIEKLKDYGTERALLSILKQNGRDAFIDSDAIVSPKDFALPLNETIYVCMQEIAENLECNNFNSELIQFKSKELGLHNYFESKENLEYLGLLDSGPESTDNISVFAYQIKKYSVLRDLYKRYNNAIRYLENVGGEQKLSEIITHAESEITDYLSHADNTNDISKLSDGLNDRIEYLINSEPVTQVGIPTGFTQWDDAIGGGPRRGTISVIGARSKKGKSFVALNMAINIAKIGIPVLYLDTELTEEYQQNRMVCIESRCPLLAFETGRFQVDSTTIEAVKESSEALQRMPLYYKSISGVDYKEALAYARRWLVKNVGFYEDGTAKDCVIIYDYLKLVDTNRLTKFTPEYIVLGMMLTEMHNFAVKYKLPIIGFVQLNREGIESTETSVVAGSDRILWLSSSLSFLKNKTEEDGAMGCGWEHGNKKLMVAETRQGSGHEVDADYINLIASLKPHTSKREATGFIKEGFLCSEIIGGMNA